MKYSFVITSIVMTLVIWVISILGGFSIPDALLYDQYVRSCATVKKQPSEVLLIGVSAEDLSMDTSFWVALVGQLQILKPEKILFLDLPHTISDKFWVQMRRHKNIVIGVKTKRGGTKGKPFSTVPDPDKLAESQIEFAAVTIPPSYHGIHRHQQASYEITGKTYDTIEYKVYRQAVKDNFKHFQKPFLIDFRGKENSLPLIDFDRAVAGGLLPQLTSGKYVIIGLNLDDAERKVSTPITPHKGMTPIRFHGHSLDTLLKDNVIMETASWMTLLIIFGIVVINLACYQFISIRMVAWISFPFTLACIVLPWLLLLYMKIWIPLVEILISNLLSVYFVYRKRSITQELSNQKLLIDTTVKLRERYIPESFYDSSEHWNQVISMVNQSLDLSRSIFLERIKGDHRVKEVIALNCDIDDISERRRDYERTPYSTAILEGNLIEIKDRAYLSDTENDEIQYLAPLVFGGIVQGFWAFGIEPKKRSEIDNFQTLIMSFAGQIGELLYRREQRLLLNKDSEQGLSRLLSLEGSDRVYKKLNTFMAMLDQRLILFESLFRNIGMAVILYDMFGRPALINEAMLKLLKKYGYLPFDMTGIDLCTALTGKSLEEARQLFREVFSHHEQFSLAIPLENDSEKSYLLKIRPLIPDGDKQILEESYPVQTLGFIFEIIETTDLEKVNRLKSDFLNHIHFKLGRDLQNITLGLSLLMEKKASKEQRKRSLRIMNRRMAEIFNFITETPVQFNKGFGQSYQGKFPLVPSKILSSADRAFKEMAEQKRVKIETELPDLVSFVCARPQLLEKSVMTIMEILINDAREGSKIKSTLFEIENQVILNFVNEGFGMPNEDLQDHIFGNTEVHSKSYRDLRRIAREIFDYGWTIQATSEIGTGIGFTIYLDTGVCILDDT